MHIKGFSSGNNMAINDVDNVLPDSLDKYNEEITNGNWTVEGKE